MTPPEHGAGVGADELIALACEESAHAYFRDGADPIHGVCGSTLYTLTGDLIEP